ncbi:MAG: hypothetical protein GAK35_02748 [Herbaspirillum frisingense]|uniref:DUF3850 domain-containing protein n=1 Tax=Herbaspirillum frisingense TaxID=92645 RepID=A0A7V8FVV0_9BURK|nr:MAG: hypothetical protein GAK35_02748 [Herbaspirillum frisingense]
MRIHSLKCWPEPFADLLSGAKTHEFRLNDRDYQAGDVLKLQCFDPATEHYTGAVLQRKVTHVLRDGFGLPAGYAVLSLSSCPLDDLPADQDVALNGQSLLPDHIHQYKVVQDIEHHSGTTFIAQVCEICGHRYGSTPPEATPLVLYYRDLAMANGREVLRLNQIINSPQSGDFLRAVSTEGEHQRQRWGSSHDAGKTAADWFWLVGHLAGKALDAHAADNIEKAEHHVITAAAALLNWHMAMFGKTDMRPGIDGAPAPAMAQPADVPQERVAKVFAIACKKYPAWRICDVPACPSTCRYDLPPFTFGAGPRDQLHMAPKDARPSGSAEHDG